MTLEEHLRALLRRVATYEDLELARILTDSLHVIRRRAEESPGECRMAEMVFEQLAVMDAAERSIASQRKYTDAELSEAAEMHRGYRAAGRALGLAHTTIMRAADRHAKAVGIEAEPADSEVIE
jgi:hypothetical protein